MIVVLSCLFVCLLHVLRRFPLSWIGDDVVTVATVATVVTL